MVWLKRALMGLGGLVVLVFVIAAFSGGGTERGTSGQAPAATVDVYETTVADLERDYAANEIATDQRIGGRAVKVVGRIKSIEKDFTDAPVLALQASNQYLPARMSLERDQVGNAAKLSVGATVTVVCAKMRYVMQTPAGYDCVLAQ